MADYTIDISELDRYLVFYEWEEAPDLAEPMKLSTMRGLKKLFNCYGKKQAVGAMLYNEGRQGEVGLSHRIWIRQTKNITRPQDLKPNYIIKDDLSYYRINRSADFGLERKYTLIEAEILSPDPFYKDNLKEVANG